MENSMVTSKNKEKKEINSACFYLLHPQKLNLISSLSYIICLKQLIITPSDVLRSSNSSVQSCNNCHAGISKFSEGPVLTFPLGSYLPSAEFWRAVSNSYIIYTFFSLRNHRLTGFTLLVISALSSSEAPLEFSYKGRFQFIYLFPFIHSMFPCLSLCSPSICSPMSLLCIWITSENIFISVSSHPSLKDFFF